MKVLARSVWPPEGGPEGAAPSPPAGGGGFSPARPPSPDLSFIPAMARRRLTPLERIALYVAHEVLTHPAPGTPHQAPGTLSIPVVFASRYGEISTTMKLMRQQHDEGELSPAGFSSSVHNAFPGVLSLLTHNRAPYTAIAAGPDSREMGLLEASAYPGRVLFVYAEETTPADYAGFFPAPVTARAEALLIDNTADGRLGGRAVLKEPPPSW